MSQEQKLDELFELVKGMKEQLDKQDEQIEYIVARLNHMRDKVQSANPRRHGPNNNTHIYFKNRGLTFTFL